jgi:hypothetical protein
VRCVLVGMDDVRLRILATGWGRLLEKEDWVNGAYNGVYTMMMMITAKMYIYRQSLTALERAVGSAREWEPPMGPGRGLGKASVGIFQENRHQASQTQLLLILLNVDRSRKRCAWILSQNAALIINDRVSPLCRRSKQDPTVEERRCLSMTLTVSLHKILH